MPRLIVEDNTPDSINKALISLIREHDDLKKRIDTVKNSIVGMGLSGIEAQIAELEEDVADMDTRIGNLSTTVAKKVSGGVYGSFEAGGIAYASITSPNAMILAIPAGSELWVQMNSSQATTLKTNGVLPNSSNPGVMHIVRPGNGGRCLLEHYADNGKHYHYETSNVSSETGAWYVDTTTKC